MGSTKGQPWAQGAGPGELTPDGCAVELYARLPAGGEPEIVAGAAPAGASILELGAGAGRITHALLARGYRVVAVDESAEMLAHIRGAQVVHARIEELSLKRKFDVVLLMSYLVAVPDVALRRAWLATCHRHATPTGCVLIQRHTPHWFDSATPYERMANGVTYRLRQVDRPGRDLMTAAMEYEIDGRRWQHTYTHARVGDEELKRDLAAVDLRLDGLLTEDRGWIRAIPNA